ncbi:MAG: FemAB family PEP-CTERM system-associated protein [Candidatus Thiodiazotropha sp.]|jgi:FemAB-related protein (PEP-CTERM system-associated)
MSEIDVISDSSKNREDWNNYLLSASEANFYQRFEWQQLNQDHFGHQIFSILSRGDAGVEGVLPLVFIKSRLFGRIFCSMPFVNFGGVCANSDDIEKKLLEKAIQLSDQHQVDYLEMRSTKSSVLDLPESTRKVSMSIKLDEDHDKLWSAFKSKHRTNIRRVYKNDIQVVSGHAELLDDFYLVMSHSWRDLGTPFYKKRYFKKLLDLFGKEDIKIFVAYRGGEPICVALNGYYKKTVEGMWMGTILEHRHLQPTYALYWEMIKDSCENGYVDYHLGRSTADSSGEAFKKKWNAEMTQLYWQYYIPGNGEIPQLNVDNAKYKLAIDIWKRLPLSIVGRIGPLISKSIP